MDGDCALGRNAKEKASCVESVPVGASLVVTSGFYEGLEFPIECQRVKDGDSVQMGKLVIEVTVSE